ncbi:MAG: hypothetical protein OJF59_001386 [Cytophagales bacterium]|jgi:ABC-type glycerol-3-phosphate transport system substrate-binding protein|nr:MAG: hypothetical protein OJF59_001386 [Cytophagales bacterium]
MKKSILVLIVAVMLVASACSQYTCPTYSKAAEAKKEIRI